jgi:hypothetical protein
MADDELRAPNKTRRIQQIVWLTRDLESRCARGSIFRGVRQRCGIESAFRSSRTKPFQSVRLPVFRVSHAYLSMPIASKHFAMSMA